jgi:hypothetical protein
MDDPQCPACGCTDWEFWIEPEFVGSKEDQSLVPRDTLPLPLHVLDGTNAKLLQMSSYHRIDECLHCGCVFSL